MDYQAKIFASPLITLPILLLCLVAWRGPSGREDTALPQENPHRHSIKYPGALEDLQRLEADTD